MISKSACIGTLVVGIAVAGSGCGDDGDQVASNAVATVGDRAITRVAFRSQLASYAQNNRPLQFDPPDFSRCVAARAAKSSAPEGEKAPDAGKLRAECRREYEQLRAKAMEALIQQAWIQQEAERQDVHVADRKVRRIFDGLRKSSFPQESKYRQYLERTRLRESTLVAQVRTALTNEAIDEHVQDGVRAPSDKDIAAYYEKHRDELRNPERRHLHAVIAGTKAKAAEAKRALEAGDSWPSVVRRYSLDKASIKSGGEVKNYVGGAPFSGDLDSVVVRARRGVLTGPVKTQFTWWVFEVDEVIPSTQRSLAEVRGELKTQLTDKRRERALNEYAREFRVRYRAQTVCAEDYEVAVCKNGPKQRPSTTGEAR